MMPVAIVGAIVVLGLLAWQLSAYFTRQHQEQCQSLLAQAQTASDANDFDKAAIATKDAEGVCTGDGSTRLQALNVVIQAGKAQASVCASTETQAKELLDKGLPAQASELMFKAHADCASRPTFSSLVKQPAAAQSEAKSLLIQASSAFNANAIDDAQHLLDQALALDSDVADGQALMVKLAAKHAKLPPAPESKPVPASLAAAPPPSPAPAPAVKETKVPAAAPQRVESVPAPRPETARVTPPPPPTPAPAAPPPLPIAAPPPETVRQPAAPRNQLIPISTPQPDYPKEARRTGVEGEVVVSFTVNTDGSVGDIKIVRAKPLGVFNLDVKNAVRRWRYQPLDQPQTVTRTITYKLTGDD